MFVFPVLFGRRLSERALMCATRRAPGVVPQADGRSSDASERGGLMRSLLSSHRTPGWSPAQKMSSFDRAKSAYQTSLVFSDTRNCEGKSKLVQAQALGQCAGVWDLLNE
jgi:hypothetical protein